MSTDYLKKPKVEEASSGAVVGIVIIILVLISGAIVVFYNQYQKSKSWQELYQTENTALPQTLTKETPLTSTSTNITDIEEDLQATDLDAIQTELNALDINL